VGTFLALVCLSATAALADVDYRHKYEKGTNLAIVANFPEDSEPIQLVKSLWGNQQPEGIQYLRWEEAFSEDHLRALASAEDKDKLNAIYLFVTRRGEVAGDWEASVAKVDPRLTPPKIAGDAIYTRCVAKMRQGKDTRYQQMIIVAPNLKAMSAEVQRVARLKGVPRDPMQGVWFVASVLAPSPLLAQSLVYPGEARAGFTEVAVYDYSQSRDFLTHGAAGNRFWLIDRGRAGEIPAEVLKAAPVDPFACEKNEIFVASRPIGDGRFTAYVYSAPCERHLARLIENPSPRRDKLLDLSQITTLAFVRLSDESARMPGLARMENVVWQSMFNFATSVGLKVVEREALEALVREHRINLSGFVDESTAAQAGQMLGAHAVVLATITAVSGTTRYDYTEDRRRDGKQEKWAWHYQQKRQESASVTCHLRLVSVATAEVLWSREVSGNYAGNPENMGEEIVIDEVGGRKPYPPSGLRKDTVPGCSEDSLAEALDNAVRPIWEDLNRAALWGSDLKGGRLAPPAQQVAVWGTVQYVEGDTIYAVLEPEASAQLRVGARMFVLREITVGGASFWRTKAVLEVTEVKEGAVACRVVESKEAVTVGDLICTVENPKEPPP